MKALLSFLVAVSLCLTARAVTLQAAEWFIDSDPGEGSGTAFTGFSGGMASLDLTISAGTINGLSEGVHLLGVRFQDSEGAWGQIVWRPFLNQHPNGGLAAGEFFFNADPGHGAATPLPGFSGPGVSADFSTSLAGLPAGANLLGVRFRDGDDEWGQTVFRVFLNPEAGSRVLNRLEFVVYRGGTPVSSGALLGDGSMALNLTHKPVEITPVLGETLLLELQVVDDGGWRGHKVFREIPVQEFSESFRDLFFTVAEQSDPAVSGNGADADGDGIDNLIEQLAGLHPREKNRPDDATGLTSLPGGMRFRFRAAAEGSFDPVESEFLLGGLRASIEVTTDFSAWAKATAPEDFTVSTDSAAGDQRSFLHVIDLVTSGREKGFYRLKVAQE